VVPNVVEAIIVAPVERGMKLLRKNLRGNEYNERHKKQKRPSQVSPIECVTVSPKVSPNVIAAIFMIQKTSVLLTFKLFPAKTIRRVPQRLAHKMRAALKPPF
jgi:hypothetical protein